MQQFQETAKRLRAMADEIEGLHKAMAMPVQHVDIPAAFAKLRAVLGGNLHLLIKPPDFDSYSGDRELTMKSWSVYLGYEAPNGAHGSHEGVTLADAVNAALKACEPPKEGNAKAEMEEITEAFAEPLPM